MLLDNSNDNKKVYEWIEQYTENGFFDCETGYFTIGALNHISKVINEKVKDMRFILGDIVSTGGIEDRAIDLLNENISVEAALKLSKISKEAVEFLKQEKVELKTLEPNFCHAKLYLFKSEKDDRHDYFISGSSNLTESGIGLKITGNVELNIAETGQGNQFKELKIWFNDIWKSKKAHSKKTIIHADGTKTEKDFKQYIIEEIEKVFREYLPKEIYYKILFELFWKDIGDEVESPDFNKKIGRVENTVLYNSLFDFQKSAVISLVKMIQKYNGAILADAVGLGKTWTALAVMKFYEMEGYEVILFCPKKLDQNWRKFLHKHNSRFEQDRLNYTIRYHTDLQDDRLQRYQDGLTIEDYFQSDRPKLFVIDESHNLRNERSSRYQFLIDYLLKKNKTVKVLMLSATPINNSLNDIRNQFRLIVKGGDTGFTENLGIRNLMHLFRNAQREFNKWSEEGTGRISDFIKKLNPDFFKLIDSLLVSRTRKHVESINEKMLNFPEKELPENIFITPKEIGNIESFKELLDHFPYMSGYQPAWYVEEKEVENVIEDEKQRDRFLVKMMYILLIKRLESSWFSFKSTVEKISEHHQEVLNTIKQYNDKVKSEDIDIYGQMTIFDEEEDAEFEEFTLGKKRTVNISEIDRAGKLDLLKKDLKKDIDKLDSLITNVRRFSEIVEKETGKDSVDSKLKKLIQLILKKQENSNNKKVLIFTVFKDTATYLYNELTKRGFQKVAMVSGDETKSSDGYNGKFFEPVLERFAPFTKLFMEKEWVGFERDNKKTDVQNFNLWIEWTKENKPEVYKKIDNSVDILIATDCLSEGQNLQDCDYIVNYDIHWNPVRIIQRMGRIDRIGSPNKKIKGVNFWPSESIESYLDLQKRVADKMAAMTLAGSEVPAFSKEHEEMLKDETLEQRQNAKMMKLMESSWDEVQKNSEGLGFDDFSLESFRQELFSYLEDEKEKYIKMPNGVYSGFIKDGEFCKKNGLVALLGSPSRPSGDKKFKYERHELVYIDENGNSLLLNQKDILRALSENKEKQRHVDKEIDNGNGEKIKKLSMAIRSWVESQAYEVDENGEKVLGKKGTDILEKIKSGNCEAIKDVKGKKAIEQRYCFENYDLIAWMVIE
ncbi:MAG TPA: helicase-related protein [bacterium]|nr:helicase-related protein [bacterium]